MLSEQSQIAEKDSGQQKSLKELFIVSTGHGLTHWYPATFYLLLPLIGSEFGLSYAEIGFLITCQAIAKMIFSLPGGALVDVIGRRKVLLAVSLFLTGFPYLIMGFSNTYGMILVCIALVGIGNSLWNISAVTILSQHYSNRRGFSLAVHGVENGKRDEKKKEKTKKNATSTIKDYWIGLKELAENKYLILLSLSGGLRSMTQNVLLTFLPLYLGDQMGFSLFIVGLCLFLFQGAGFVAASVAGHLLDKIGRRQVIMASMGISAVVLVFMGS